MQFIEIAAFLLFWLIGLLAGSYLLINSLICIRVGIIQTNLLVKEHILSPEAGKWAKNYYRKSPAFLIPLLLLISAAVFLFAGTFCQIGYGIGLAIALLVSFGKTGPTEANRKEYIETLMRAHANGEFASLVPTVYCKNCGTEIEPDALYCKTCGLKVQ